jgi:hypothetical protein
MKNNKNIVKVETKLGTIMVEIKSDEEYPGVLISLCGLSVNDKFLVDRVDLAMIEYEPNKNKVQSVIYGDGNSDEPTHIVEYENINKEK